MKCPKCKNKSIKDGKTNAGTQRYRCKVCGFRFCKNPKPILGSRQNIFEANRLRREGFSLREIAGLLSVNHQTVSNWIGESGDPYIYLMKGRGGLSKIGITTQLEARRRQVERDVRSNVEIIHCFRCANPRVTERLVHRSYSSHRVEGEWFRLSDCQIDNFPDTLEYIILKKVK